MKKIGFLFFLLCQLISIQSIEWEFSNYLNLNNEECMIGRIDVPIISENEDKTYFLTIKVTPVDVDVYMQLNFKKNDTLNLDFIDEHGKVTSIPLYVFDDIATIQKEHKPYLFDILSENSEYHVLIKRSSDVIFDFNFDTRELQLKFGIIYEKGVPVYFL